MDTIIDLLWVALITIYIVDLSGFNETLLTFISHYTGKRVTSFKPFSCSLCMVWWAGLIYLLIVGAFTLPYIAMVALLSFLSVPLGQLLILIREALNKAIDKLFSLL